MTTALEEEMRQVLTDWTWLNDCTCSQLENANAEFFVSAGQTISPAALNWARACPARRKEVLWAYGRGIKPGYIGGLSSGQRQSMSLQEALEFIENDPPQPELELVAQQ